MDEITTDCTQPRDRFILSEEVKKNLPVMTEEELAELVIPHEELLEMAYRDFYEKIAQILTEEILKRFPNLVLKFVEKNNATNRAYPVDLHFNEIKHIDNVKCVFKGKAVIAGRASGLSTIEYDFNAQEFYRVTFSNKTKRCRRMHKLIEHNEELINELIAFIG